MIRRLWRTRAGRALCAVLTGNAHVFYGWDRQPGYAHGQPLPMAYCERCGAEF